MADQNFQWTDELVKEFSRHIRLAFENPKDFNCGKWAGLDTELRKWKLNRGKYNGYEVIGYIRGYTNMDNVIFKKENNGLFYNFPKSCTPTEEISLKQNGYLEYSIKRLSDGQTFTIGDRLDEMLSKDVVDGFKFDYKGNAVWVSVDMETGCGVGLKYAKHFPKKQLLFTTEDGVEIFDRSTVVIGIDKITCNIVSGKGDTLGVWTNGWYTTNEYPNPKTSDDPEVLKYLNDRYVLFYNKDKARQWINENKPIQVSYKELKEAFSVHKRWPNQVLYNDLKEFFKSKINP